MPTFSPPTVDDVPRLLPRTRGPAFHLFKWYKSYARGRTVLKESGQYRVTDTPTSDEINAAEIAYIGGHIYTVTETEAADLVAAGFTVQGYPVIVPPVPYPSVLLFPSTELYPGVV